VFINFWAFLSLIGLRQLGFQERINRHWHTI